jgi:2-methylcitrate dehydratase PrpD
LWLRIPSPIIERIIIETQESGKRIIDKSRPLDNPADRDYCIQYMVAVPFIFGRLTVSDYEDEVASDPRIDALRGKMARDRALRSGLSDRASTPSRRRDPGAAEKIRTQSAQSDSSA